MSSRARRAFRLLGSLGLFAITAAGPVVAQGVDLAPPTTKDDFVRLAEERSPRLRFAKEAWEAEIGALDADGSFPDPRLTYGWYAEPVETRVGPQKHRISVVQRIPWFGKLGLRRRSAEEAAAATESWLETERFEVRRDASHAWYDLYLWNRTVDITGNHLELLVQLESVVRGEYRTGGASHADLVRVQMELGLLEDRLQSLRDRGVAHRARANELLDRPASTDVPAPESLPRVPDAPDAEDVRTVVRSTAPRLRVQDHELARARVDRDLARRQQWPDWAFGVDWIITGEAMDPATPGSGKDAVLVNVALELPLFRGKHAAPVREREQRLAAARSERSREERSLLTSLETILFEWRDADRRADLYETALIPKAQESLETRLAAYRSGAGGFQELIEAQRTKLEFELALEEARTDRARSAADLERITGISWEGRQP